MSVPAVYVDPGRTVAVACSIRVHNRTQAFGDMVGFDYAPVERLTPVPKIVALAGQVSPARGGTFVLAADEAYDVEVVEPRDGLTITSQVTRMSVADLTAAGLPLPGSDLTAWPPVPEPEPEPEPED